MDPLVSVIIPTFNRKTLIGETLNSVLAQTYTNWECIIVDDGSTDTTEELVKAYSKKDDRIQFYHRPEENPKGSSSCRNYGLEKARGEYIQFLDSDDLISKEKFEHQVKLLEVDPLNSFATCKWGTFRDQVHTAEIHQNLRAYNSFEEPLEFINALSKEICYFPIHAYLIRNTIIRKAGAWNEYLSLNDDSEFMVRVFVNSKKICFSDSAVAYYRRSTEDNLSVFNDENKVLDAIYSWKLIENYLKIRYKKEGFSFMERAKNDFYNQAKIFPELLTKNKEFFKFQLRRESSWVRRIFFRN